MQPPRSATILVGVFSSLAAVIAFAAGMTLIWPGSAVDVIWAIRNDDTHAKMLALGWPVGAGLWVIAAVGIACAIGSLQRRRWAWWIAAAAMGANIVSDLVRLAMGGVIEGLFGVVIAGLILFWLARPGVRAQFSR